MLQNVFLKSKTKAFISSMSAKMAASNPTRLGDTMHQPMYQKTISHRQELKQTRDTLALFRFWIKCSIELTVGSNM